MNDRNRIIFMLSFFLLSICSVLPAQAAQRVPVVVTSNTFAFGEKLADLEVKKAGNASISSMSVYSSRRLVVKVKENISDVSTFFGNYGAIRVVRGPEGLYGLQFATVEDTKKAATGLRQSGQIQYAEPDYKSSAQKINYTPMSTGSVRIGSKSFAEQILESTSSPYIKVAIVDSGIAPNTILRKNNRILSDGYNFIDRNKKTKDEAGHGTHVAGIVWDVTYGLNVKLLPVKVLDENGDGDVFALVDGINYAVSKGAKVINVSINLDRDMETGKPIHSEYLHETLKKAKSKGVIVVCSAGNNGGNVKNACPAECSEPIVVGAIDEDDKRAPFSNIGNSVDVVAPGVDILSTGIKGKIYMSGTSMATPHITGVVAMLRLMYPSYTQEKIESLMYKYTDRLGGTTGKNKYYGWGVPNLKKIKTRAAKSLKLNASTQTVKATETISLKATVAPGNTTLKTVNWRSSNTKVAVVKNGIVVGVAPGTADITASTANGKKAVCKVTVKAASRVPRTNFSLQSYNVDKEKATITGSTFKGSDGIEVQLQNENKKTIATVQGKSSCTFSKLMKNKIYYYRARAYYDINGTRVFSEWSYRRVFCTAMPMVKISEEHNNVAIQTTKTTGVYKYNIYISLTNEVGSYTKVKTVVPGEVFYCSSVNGKPLDAYDENQEFYVLFKPVYQKQEMADTKYIRTKFALK